MPLEAIFERGHVISGTTRPGADYRSQVNLATPGQNDEAGRLAGAGLTNPKGFVPPDCPRCGRQMKLLWRGMPHLGCPKKLHGCGLIIWLRRDDKGAGISSRGWSPYWSDVAFWNGMGMEAREAFMRVFRAAVAEQLRTQARLKGAADLAAQIPAELRLARALSMFPQWFLRAGRTHQLMSRSDGKVVLKPLAGCPQGGVDVPCPACPEFKAKEPLARCMLCLGFGVVPRLLAEWWIERRGELRRPAA